MSCYAELNRRYREIDQRRKQAQQNLSDVQQFIATTLRLVEPGNWTAHDDLAELVATTPTEVADFLASGKVKLANAYRVLNADGSIPAEGMLNYAYRGRICAVGWPTKVSSSTPAGTPGKISD